MALPKPGSLRFLSLLLSFFILTGCGTVHYDNVKMNQSGTPVASKLTNKQKESMRGLTKAIKNLGPNVSPQEATVIAHDAIVYSMVLANKYKLTYPPLWHNVLVNAKKRPRGLCYHWQRDLISYFNTKGLKTVDIKEGVAHEKDYWQEHNTMVVTAKGKPFNTGIVLDPWRNSGILTWAKVTEDKYPWKLRVWKKDRKKKQLSSKKKMTPETTL